MLEVDENVIALVQDQLRLRDDLNQTTLAEALGYKRSWMSRFLDGDVKTLHDDVVDKLESVLGVKIIRHEGEQIPSEAVEIARAMNDSDDLRNIVLSALRLSRKKSPIVGKWFPTKDMPRIGARIITICFDNEHQAGKVAREVLKLLTEWEPSSERRKRAKKRARAQAPETNGNS